MSCPDLRMSERYIATLLGVLLVGSIAVDCRAIDISQVPLWDGETSSTPNGPLINRFGGQPVHLGGTQMQVQRTTATVHAGAGGYRIDTLNPIAAGGFGFFQTALAPAAAGIQPGRDLRGFDQTSFWLKNDTGSNFTLKFEIKDYRDSGSHVAWRNIPIPSSGTWQQVQIPMNLASPGWNVVGSPDMSRARLFGFVIDANQQQGVAGSLYLDDVQLREAGGALDSQSATLEQLAGRLAQRQFLGLWGSRNHTNGLIPIGSTTSQTGAMNSTAAVVKMLPGAVRQGWIPQSDADSYMQTLVSSLNTAMSSSTYVPPRYLNMQTLSPAIAEESVIDAAFMALALHQYKTQPSIAPGLADQIDALQNRFNFAAFSDTQGPTQGWKLAYQTNTQSFTSGTYDGYSGEPWVISLAAELATQHHVDIERHYHSGVLRVHDYLVNAADAHLVHTFDSFRAPFLQWLLPLFVDVSDRGVDTYPVRSLASNPLANAVKYQREVQAYFAAQNRGLLLQPDAGDDGSGNFYQQFSAYQDFGRADLLMPWSAAVGLLGDAGTGTDALRHLLERGLQGPLGLSDSARWTTGAASPYALAAGNDLWNTSLSTMALMQLLDQDNSLFTQLPEVAGALDRVFYLTWDGPEDGQWNSHRWGGGMAPPTLDHDARILDGIVTVEGVAQARRLQVLGGGLRVNGILESPVHVHAGGQIQGQGEIAGDLQLDGTFVVESPSAGLAIDGMLSLAETSNLSVADSYEQTRGTEVPLTVLVATEGIEGTLANPAGAGIASHLGDGHFLQDILYGPGMVAINVLAALPGDANGDQVVDGTDFGIWNSHKFEQGTSWITGDFNGDQRTDGSDFNLWNAFKFTAYDAHTSDDSTTRGNFWWDMLQSESCRARRIGPLVPEPMGSLGFWLVAYVARRSACRRSFKDSNLP